MQMKEVDASLGQYMIWAMAANRRKRKWWLWNGVIEEDWEERG